MEQISKVIDSLPLERILTAEQLLEIHNISLDEWNVDKQIINKWDVGAKGPDGNIVVTPLFQVKVFLSKKQILSDYRNIREEFIQDIQKLSPVVPLAKSKSTPGSNLLQINIFDLHFGKMAWAEETGYNYDTKIASELFINALSELVHRSKGYDIDRILLPVGNDFFNSDYSHPFNKTTNGTPQEEDLRWQKTFREGRQLLIKGINMLSQIAPVDVVIVPGNHDFERCFYLGDSLEGWFHNNENVTVDNKANPRKYYNYGLSLIGLTHGNNEKVQDLPLIMANECPELWSKTKFREFHLGHWHHKKEIKYKSTDEYNGTTIRYMSSLCATDSWHHKKGYITSKRTADAYIWDKEKGLVANLVFNI